MTPCSIRNRSNDVLAASVASRYSTYMAGTEKTRAAPHSMSPAVVLVNPQLGENIGTAIRAMANFGLSELRIVDPRDGWPSEKAISAAAGADWIIESTRVYDRLEDALLDVNHVYATTARPRGLVKEILSPEQAGSDMRERIGRGEKLGVLFGRERWGLSNDEISLADVIITAPVDPAFASLNIAQAVLLVGYEWYKGHARTLGQATPELPALSGPGLRLGDARPATKKELFGLFGHLESELESAGFFKTPEKKPGMVRNTRNLLARARLTEQEVRSLRGMVASLARSHLRNRKPREQ